MLQLRQRDYTHEQPVFILIRQPSNHAGVWLWLGPLRNHIRVQQKVHSSVSRGESFTRSISKPLPRKGDDAKNSARFPFRLVFRFHSSADTTTAASFPWRVIRCGPELCARSITSLSFALASATVQCVFPTVSLLAQL